MFLLDEGSVFVRDEKGAEAGFNSVEEFSRYYPGKIDLSGYVYIDYEPEKKVFFSRRDAADFSSLENQFTDPIAEFEEIIRDAAGMKERLENPYFDLSVKEAGKYKLKSIKNLTYRTITLHMPEWKQLRWNQYLNIHEKKENAQSLTPFEQALYDGFPGSGESHNECVERVRQALLWILECREANNRRELELESLKSVQEIMDLKEPGYPGFPF